MCPTCNPILYSGSNYITIRDVKEHLTVDEDEILRLKEIESKYNELVKAINTLKNVSWP
jgi:hypothetical protein